MRALLAIVVLTGCGSVPTELHGTWSASGDLGGGHSWMKEYVVDADGFSMSGYPPISKKCDLELLSTEGSVHTFRATGCMESAPGPEVAIDDHDIRIEVAGDAITWDGEELHRQQQAGSAP
ncbi:MAG: hypothetical protein JJ863_07090 [Deltaproteobacteria bacterium]|nr:hypothetical protein [Deltaproteobacteria bacterium]